MSGFRRLKNNAEPEIQITASPSDSKPNKTFSNLTQKDIVKENTNVIGHDSIVSQEVMSKNNKRVGVKPWSSIGCGVVSSGHRQLDDILSGGHVLGSSLLLISDNLTDYAETLLKYEISESISMKHKVIIIESDTYPYSSYGSGLSLTLPYNLNGSRIGGASQSSDLVNSSSMDHRDEEASHRNHSDSLKIAWQYQKYLPKTSHMSIEEPGNPKDLDSVYCCSYDLSRSLQPYIVDASPAVVLRYSLTSLESVFQDIQRLLRQHDSTDVVRVFIPHLEHLYDCSQDHSCNSRALGQMLLRLNRIIRDEARTLTVCCHPTLLPSPPTSSSIIGRLSSIVDTVLELESFAGHGNAIPYEYKEFVGFLVVRKVQQLGSQAPPRPPYERYGIKRNRRKLCIEPLHLPPEESRALARKTETTDRNVSTRSRAAADGKLDVDRDEKPHHHLIPNASEGPQPRINLQLEAAPPVSGQSRLALSLANARATRQALKDKDSGRGGPRTDSEGTTCSSTALDF